MNDSNTPKPRTHYVDPDHANLMDDVLEIGDTDRHGNKHPDHAAYEAEMERRFLTPTQNQNTLNISGKKKPVF